MKFQSIVFFLFFISTTFLFVQNGFSQTNSYSLSPKVDSALVRFSIFDAANKPLQTKVCFYGKNTKKTFCINEEISKANNQNEILLPNNDTYLVYSSISVLAYQIPVSDIENQFYNLAFAFPTDKADQIQPTPENALIRILPINHEKEPQKAKIILTSKKDNSIYNSHTDSTNSEGAAVFLIPTGDIYSISINGNQNYDKIEVAEQYFSKVDKYIQYEGMKIGKIQPSLDSAVFNIIYSDLEEKPAINEIFTITSKSTGKEYKTLPTDENGKAQIKIPIGDTYSIGIKYLKDFMEQEVSSDEGIYILPLEILYPSSEQIEARRKEMEEADKKREIEWKKLEKEMAALDKKNEELRLERIKKEQEEAEKAQKEYEIQVENLRLAKKLQDSLESIQRQKDIQEQIKKDKKKEEERKELAIKKEAKIKAAEAKELRDILKRNQYSWGSDTIVSKILNGKKEWKKKLFVLDVTSSMLPYIEQVKYWYSLNYAQDSTMEFYLFNDGNGMSSARKQIGITGGIYECKGCKINKLEQLITQARTAGNGGDSQENDLEAILYALKYTDGYDELVLVADNMSYARDMILIEKIGVPIRIILCGTSRFVNEQYLNIAYLTGGSVHTIEEEINDLSDMIEGKMITVSGYQYRFTKGRFFRMPKK
ncbi:hypothetical protein Fleli_0050 [Bernardetia litoralis DSM 6794]|uniref:Uncharacterized protein n=1 Tax=Bernardetia litoralis (strain ATCC 23117 / DSM 6794 / NBRC 15988 / NCIMB 1366 / Fx l1 / Sio-4) TaxID=880071 RepID=I4AF26_BERLS|nr:hypothetical protein [Bernardetia litoralis]AFM02561.1 hypothetical protein Fleli_0050 [Bernardetia litoralis DSM 6794]